MNKAVSRSLNAQLLLSQIIAVILSAAVFLGVLAAGNYTVEHYYMSPANVSSRKAAIYAEFASYVRSGQFTGQNEGAVAAFNRSHRYADIAVYPANTPNSALISAYYGKLYPMTFADGAYAITIVDSSDRHERAINTVLATVSGISGGAEYILIPEEQYDLEKICTDMKAAYDAGKRYILVVLAEGAGNAQDVGNFIAEKTGIDTRVSVLGHIQRGGSPTVLDRVRASQLGEQAALALISGLSDIVFGYSKGHVVTINLHDAVTNKKRLDPEYTHLAKVLF